MGAAGWEEEGKEGEEARKEGEGREDMGGWDDGTCVLRVQGGWV
ncbi:MAG: hypothetical protein RMK80_08830 [Pseudobdellovibrionaceae bacterium]|nr:hypothetical protein [Pseudobdellovibrionaceae bacterium]